MAERLSFNAESKGSEHGNTGCSSDSLFYRRIDFHLARKPFAGLGSGGGGGGDFRIETLNPSLSNQMTGLVNQCKSGVIVKKVEGSEFLESGLDPELSFGITVRRIGAGLENLGNTCFLNSVLQCLTYTEPLAAYLQSGKHQNSCHIAGFCALCAIQKHVSRALQSTGRILAPKDLVSNLRCISRNFRNARQEDAHEYMVNLLESMHKCCLPSGVPSESPSAYEKSLVHKIFGGRLRSQVKCRQCSYCSNTFDPFLDLSLEIAKAESLQRALVNFTAAEELDGGEKQYQCQRCKQKVRALKQLTVHKAPYVLTIHLKRFRSHDPGQKIDKKVHFGPTLDLKPFVSGSYDGDLKYTLYGVLVHLGWSTHSGHYYCFVRTSSGMWYSLDDNRVVQVSEKTVLEQKAYMLFYVRDRKNVTPKKSVDVGQRENMKVNVNGNGPSFSFNQGLKKPNQNGQIENRLSTGASAAVIQKIVPNTGLSKDTHLKEASVKPNNASIVVESSLPKKAHESKLHGELSISKAPVSEPSSEIPLSKDPPSVLSSKLGELSLPLAPSVNANTNLVSINRSSKKDVNNSVVPQNCNELQGSDNNNNIVKSDTSQKINLDSKEGILKLPLCSIPSKASETIDPIGSEPTKSAACDILRQKAGDDDKNSVPDDSVEGSILSNVTKRSLKKTNLDCTIYRKSKKKLLKSQFANMHFGPNILFKVSLGIQKKRKHKRSKCLSLGKRKHLLDEDHILSDLGPSTSEEAGANSIGSTHSRRKGSKSCSKGAAHVTFTSVESNSNDTPVRDDTQKEFRERIYLDEAVLATDKQLQKSASSVTSANQSDVRGSESSKDRKRDVMQNGLINMLNRGMDQSIVACWDGIELPPAQIVESNRVDSVTIGYVPDEWDEEYDRGKRKKVKQAKHDFGGPNPFQEVSTKKAQWKMSKMDHRSASANQPFRI